MKIMKLDSEKTRAWKNIAVGHNILPSLPVSIELCRLSKETLDKIKTEDTEVELFDEADDAYADGSVDETKSIDNRMQNLPSKSSAGWGAPPFVALERDAQLLLNLGPHVPSNLSVSNVAETQPLQPIDDKKDREKRETYDRSVQTLKANIVSDQDWYLLQSVKARRLRRTSTPATNTNFPIDEDNNNNNQDHTNLEIPVVNLTDDDTSGNEQLINKILSQSAQNKAMINTLCCTNVQSGLKPEAMKRPITLAELEVNLKRTFNEFVGSLGPKLFKVSTRDTSCSPVQELLCFDPSHKRNEQPPMVLTDVVAKSGVIYETTSPPLQVQPPIRRNMQVILQGTKKPLVSNKNMKQMMPQTRYNSPIMSSTEYNPHINQWRNYFSGHSNFTNDVTIQDQNLSKNPAVTSTPIPPHPIQQVAVTATITSQMQQTLPPVPQLPLMHYNEKEKRSNQGNSLPDLKKARRRFKNTPLRNTPYQLNGPRFPAPPQQTGMIRYPFSMDQQQQLREMELQQRAWESQLQNYPNTTWGQMGQPYKRNNY